MIILVQWIFYIGFFLLYLVSSRTAHRVVGYFEEEAVISYTLYLKEIDEGRSPNVAAPAIARHYWKMADTATWCSSFARMRLITVTSITGSPARLPAFRLTTPRRPIRPMPRTFE